MPANGFDSLVLDAELRELRELLMGTSVERNASNELMVDLKISGFDVLTQ